VKIATWQMKAVKKLISGTEIDLAELERRANQPQILKVLPSNLKLVVYYIVLITIHSD